MRKVRRVVADYGVFGVFVFVLVIALVGSLLALASGSN